VEKEAPATATGIAHVFATTPGEVKLAGVLDEQVLAGMAAFLEDSLPVRALDLFELFRGSAKKR
jgi:hypothetical protein